MTGGEKGVQWSPRTLMLRGQLERESWCQGAGGHLSRAASLNKKSAVGLT